MTEDRRGRIIKLGLLHGAIKNGGDFFIYESGKKLLTSMLSDNVELLDCLRSKPIAGEFDGLIILGGPMIARFMLPQSRNVLDYIKTKEIPVFCLGLGVAGRGPGADYSLDSESAGFWRRLYDTSKLFSVRDAFTRDVLERYGIKAELTGCPSLCNVEQLERQECARKVERIAVTIPLLIMRKKRPRAIANHVRQTLKSIYFL